MFKPKQTVRCLCKANLQDGKHTVHDHLLSDHLGVICSILEDETNES